MLIMFGHCMFMSFIFSFDLGKTLFILEAGKRIFVLGVFKLPIQCFIL